MRKQKASPRRGAFKISGIKSFATTNDKEPKQKASPEARPEYRKSNCSLANAHRKPNK